MRIPRGTFRTPVRNVLCYFEPQRISAATLLGPLSPWDSIPEQKTITGRSFSQRVIRKLPIEALARQIPGRRRPFDPVADIRREAADLMAEDLSARGLVLAFDGDLHEIADVEVTMRISGIAWPDVPGVTTAPLRALAPDMSILEVTRNPGPMKDLYHRARYEGAFEVVALVNPDDLPTMEGHPWESWIRAIGDDRVPVGMIRICERVR